MVSQEPIMAADRPGAPPLARRAATGLHGTAVYAVLTLALSLPQGLLALPVAVAQAGVGTGLMILAAVSLLNVVTVAWTARQLAAGDLSARAAASLPALAARRLGPAGGGAALAGSAALFFLALVASLVGLGRSLGGPGGAQAPAAALACGLAVLALSLGGLSLSARLLAALGLANVGLVVLLLAALAPRVELGPWPADSGSPAPALGVSLMLFFAPVLVPTVARQVPARHRSAPALVAGSALGVAATAALAGLWALAVAGACTAERLAGVSGTAVQALIGVLPEVAAPAMLLQVLLLGMTALRCALVLRALAEERLRRPAARRLTPHAPAALGLAAALAVLWTGAASFTLLVAVAGGAAASLTSLVTPALLAYAGRPVARKLKEACDGS